MSDAPRHELTVVVRPDDIDELHHVNNLVYLRWVQDVAIAHWRAAASAEAQREVAWVALRHEIDYLRAAVLGDTVVVRTWVGTASRLAFERHTEIVRQSDGRVLARARTLWCPVSTRTGRPTRVSAEVRAGFSTGEADAGGEGATSEG